LSTNDTSPIADTEVHYLDSDAVGDEFKIFVGHCGNSADAADTDAAPPAVLYVTDANGLFAGAVEIVRFMQLSAHLPPLLVVGVGYRKGGIDETIVLRARDFTPTFDPWFEHIFPEHTLMGGADRFLAFFRNELQPWVRSHYRVDPHDATYFGHSLGGLFGTYVLLTRPDTFTRYGIGSPSLWWHDDMIFGYEADYAASHDDLPAHAFFAVGANEDHDGRQREASRLSADERANAGLRYIDMVADTERMVASLRSRAYPNLDIHSIVLPDEFHITVQHVNLSRALRYLFDTPR
jgi:predicted alpha/beta superfamily hydrolase